jgi:hypothetical protein
MNLVYEPVRIVYDRRSAYVYEYAYVLIGTYIRTRGTKS